MEHKHSTPVTGASVRDPVCGMTVDPAAGKPPHSHHGRDIHFCCDGCRDKFVAAPGRLHDRQVDPVCGMRVDRASAGHMARHDGQALLFLLGRLPGQVRGRSGPLSRRPPSAGRRRQGHQIHLPDASGDRQRRPRRLPEMRHGAGADGRSGRRRRPQPGTRRFHAPASGSAPRCAVPLLFSDHGPDGRPAASATGSASSSRVWLEFLLATPVVLWAGWPFFVRGWASVVNRSPNMWTLIAMGVGAAYRFSLVAALAPGLFPAGFRDAERHVVPVYFEAAAVIVALVFVGQVLELRARERTGSAIRALLDLAPKTARRDRHGRPRRRRPARAGGGRRPPARAPRRQGAGRRRRRRRPLVGR